jgi:hypothetical protein
MADKEDRAALSRQSERVANDDPIQERAANLDTTGLPALTDSMSVLRHLMDSEYNRLKLEWQALLAERDAINQIKDRIQSVTVSEHDRLRLNVSGQRFEIRASCVQKNTYFRSLISNTFAPADTDGFYYIDRDPKFVIVILNMLRDGRADLDDFNERHLRQIRADAEYYMVGDLTNEVDRVLAARRTGTGIVAVPMNRDVPTTLSFNGVFMELTVTKRNLALHSISFVAGETRRIVGEAFCMEGSMDGQSKPQKVGEVEVDADKGQIISISFSTIALTGTAYTIGVYSSSCPTAVVACPTTMATRDYSRHGIVVERSYHTTNPRGHWTRRAGQDEFDLVGELGISF